MGDSTESATPVHRVVSMIEHPPSALAGALPAVNGDQRWLCRVLAWGRREASPMALLQYFRWCFAIKLLCTFYSTYAEPIWTGPLPVLLRTVAVLSTLAMCRRRTAWFGSLGWLGLVAAHVARTWPYTLNHFFLELIFLTMICAYPRALQGEHEGSARELRSLLFLAILSVWFFSGVQKLAHGHYLNGEAFALPLLADDSKLGAVLCGGLSFLVQGLEVDPSLAAVPPAAPGFGAFTRAYCLLPSYLVPLTECTLPLWAVWGRRRELAALVLMLGQLVIAGASGEYDFALTGVAALGLGWSRWAPARYSALTICAVASFLERTLG